MYCNITPVITDINTSIKKYQEESISMDKQKPKTYMLRLYPDSASDQILINYLKQKRNIQQYIRQLIEDDMKNKNIVKTIREVMEEYFQNNGQALQSYLSDESSDRVSDTRKPEEKQGQEIFVPGQMDDEVFSDEDEVDSITPDAFAFLEGLGQ